MKLVDWCGSPRPQRTVKPLSPAREARLVLSTSVRYAAAILAILSALVMVSDTLTR